MPQVAQGHGHDRENEAAQDVPVRPQMKDDQRQEDGQQQQSLKLPGGTFIAPVVAGNTLYVLTDDGTLVAYR